MADSKTLEPPQEANVADPGAHQLSPSSADHSDSEDQFTDAPSAPRSPESASFAPKTTVDKVSDEPADGEVAGTEANKLREADAKPDAISVIPEEETATDMSSQSDEAPATVVDESSGAVGPRSAEAEEMRQADATPDIVVNSHGDVKSSDEEEEVDDDATIPAQDATDPEPSGLPKEQSSKAAQPPDGFEEDFDDDDNNDHDGFGDDFDDFEEGDEDDDFGDFGDDGFQQPEPSPNYIPPALPVSLPFPIPDFEGLNYDDIITETETHLTSLFPPDELDVPQLPPLPKENTSFNTPRSASLWSQLVAPPPLAPPDWIRSRTRRLFLVSLGVPVDLDEILPASKQKKLVLPSLNVPASSSPRNSSESRSVSRLRQGEGNNSSTSVDTQGKPKRRKGPPPQPELDMTAARHTCTTTDEALDGMTDEELKAHVKKLQELEATAKEVLEYWQKRTDEKIGERETFEGVIENLVKHARKVRK